jgi:hypothetical protein
MINKSLSPRTHSSQENAFLLPHKTSFTAHFEVKIIKILTFKSHLVIAILNAFMPASSITLSIRKSAPMTSA